MPPHRHPAAIPARPGSRRILCVASDYAQGRTLCSTLAQPGLTLECVGSVAEALDLLADRRPACELLIVSDRAPTLDALALLRRARESGYAGPAIVLCPDRAPDRHEALRALKSALVLLQPVAPAHLRAAADASLPHAA